MKLIVGLGNPGETYKNNRHNVGFMFIDYMVTLLHGYIVKKNKNYLAIQPSNHVSFILTKPLAFMNLSGQAVKILIKNLKSKIKNLVAVHDDLDIPLGKFKIQKGVGPKLHNGIESIEKALGRKDFWRIRIGVDNRNPDKWVDGETYVLQNFTQEEKKFVLELFPKIYDRLKNNFI
ncbi:aminoacyl-tRNA hydrolase [Candidatus Roizmanbacteria bacterium RIFCSPHIGHO2_02_FULL_37_15]|uniref:Peptidyl-tRNA hydrolase n=1 Tax=Candidatus Roizmanbacteria bacterium RIFCSPLOWO2_01_FULL_37_16 TaxID=1802058 RepID=A0A1F7IQ09_9BACT|nr:MAG: aminoacyl-tRNA hydrolase [Candidatus Roizmanbacteria bacterium RIFCSPHIGHO2_01_FULL_37_16b]OGK22232.1 MAG: aminoacyl-tRNA hydrolase [Candidatus Roizmanbacteria bacterium RIFCSPHIGHO2_02_FULL_37_15]OGK45456.1 MAG: aminoacyl-tRNA hydrolase [Candidatus Roizmanbacteria bacterium RIFCSPLOWO2_01_FULL_37_16]